jgi:hypothetical protein
MVNAKLDVLNVVVVQCAFIIARNLDALFVEVAINYASIIREKIRVNNVKELGFVFMANGSRGV